MYICARVMETVCLRSCRSTANATTDHISKTKRIVMHMLHIYMTLEERQNEKRGGGNPKSIDPRSQSRELFVLPIPIIITTSYLFVQLPSETHQMVTSSSSSSSSFHKENTEIRVIKRQKKI